MSPPLLFLFLPSLYLLSNFYLTFREGPIMLFRLLGPVVWDRFSSAMCRTCPPHAPRVSLGCRIASCLQCGFFLAAIRDCFAPIGPCSGCSLFRCSHLPPGRACFTWVCALHPNDDGSLQASAAPPSGFICVGSARPDSFLRGVMLPLVSYSVVFRPSLLLWLYRQWLSVLPFRP